MPQPDDALLGRLAVLDERRQELGREVSQTVAWTGPLRRSVKGLAWQSSTSIEGFSVGEDRAELIATGEAEPRRNDQSEEALACYAQAMEHVAVLAGDPDFRWLDRVILDLHFETCRFQPDQRPGRYRDGPIAVTGPEGGIAFRGPDPGEVRSLVGDLVAFLEAHEGVDHPVVVAAMAHLSLVSIHPFADGNGRISRILQSLVLARQGLLSPEFGSIEQYLAENTSAYYAALKVVQAGGFSPDRDPLPWLEFCVEAHLEQAEARLDLVAEAARRWEILEREADTRGWDDRFVIALEQALHGSTDRSSYCREASISDATASNDFRRLVDVGLLEPIGRGRASAYRPTSKLRQLLDDWGRDRD